MLLASIHHMLCMCIHAESQCTHMRAHLPVLHHITSHCTVADLSPKLTCLAVIDWLAAHAVKGRHKSALSVTPEQLTWRLTVSASQCQLQTASMALQLIKARYP